MDKYFIKIGTNQIYFIYFICFIYFIFLELDQTLVDFLNFIEKIEIPVPLYM